MQEMVFVALDCETTGLSAESDHIIEVGMTRYTLTGEVASYDQLFHPGVQVSAFVEKLTGITNTELASQKPLGDTARTKIREFCAGATLIGHNLQFDLRFLAAAGIDLSAQSTFDTFELAGLILPRTASLSLVALGSLFGITHESAHRALSDAEATRDLHLALLAVTRGQPVERWEAIAALTAPEYHWVTRLAAQVLSLPESLARAAPTESTPERETSTAASPELQAALATGMPTLLESTLTPAQIAATLGGTGTLALPTQYAARSAAAALGGTARFAPQHYPDAAALPQFFARSHTPVTASLAAKLILHPEQNIFQYNLTRAEQLAWQYIAAETDTAASLPPLTETTGLIVTDHASLPAVAVPTRPTVVTECLRLPEALALGDSLQLDLPTLEALLPGHEQAITIFWGYLGLLLQEAAPQYGKVELSALTGLRHYAACIDTGEKLLEVAGTALPPRTAQQLAIWLHGDATGTLRILRTDASGQLTLTLAPQPRTAACGALLTQIQSVVLTDTALTIADGDFGYARRTLGLPAQTLGSVLPLPQPAPTLYLYGGLPEPAERSFATAADAAICELAAKLSGITVVIFPGQYALSQFFEKQQGRISRPLWASRLTGSQGKIWHEMQSVEHGMYLTTLGAPLPPRVTTLILPRLPFVVRDGADWLSETLPLSVLAFKKIWLSLCTVSARPPEQSLLVLDRRLTDKPYGRDFARAVGSEAVGYPHLTK